MKLRRTHLLFALLCVMWGMTWIAIKAGVTAVPPVFFAGSRFVVSGAVLMLARRPQPIARADLPRLAAVTALMIVATYPLLYWGARDVSSGLAAILNLAFTPVTLLAVGCLVGEDRLTAVRGIGVALGVAGLLVLFGPKAWAGMTQGEATGQAHAVATGHAGAVATGHAGAVAVAFGAAAVIAAAVTYSTGSVLARPLLRRYTPTTLSTLTNLAGGAILLAAALAVEPGAVAALAGRWGWQAWAGWIFLAIASSVLGFTIYLHLVNRIGASRAGAYAFVSPIIAVLLGALALGETVSLSELAGMALMLAGAALTLQPAPDPASRRPALTPGSASRSHPR